MKYNSIEIVPKIYPNSTESLALIYTPGVGESCLEIQKNPQNALIYTNKLNSTAVISFDYKKSLARAVYLKQTQNIDAYPFEIENCTQNELDFVIKNIKLNFSEIDLTLMNKEIMKFEKNDIPKIQKNLSLPLKFRLENKGVLETKLSEKAFANPPIAIISDGSAVLGLGNIGAIAGLPVMEGKAVLFKALGNVNAIPLCLETQNSEEIIKIIKLLKKSFSGINLEDISAPRCFEIEQTLVKTLDIPVFHDDQHGTAIVVLAGLTNALKVRKTQISTVKIVISGAGAAAQAVSSLLQKAGAKNIIHTDSKGIVCKNRPHNNKYTEKLAKNTNLQNIQGSLQDALKNADVFIGLSKANILKSSDIKLMNKNPIIFALANPNPEIMPQDALSGGAFIVATGRSDFDNQINNSLAFPGLFASLLEYKIKKVSDKIKLECALAISSLIKNPSTTNIIPKALDKNVVNAIKERLTSH